MSIDRSDITELQQSLDDMAEFSGILEILKAVSNRLHYNNGMTEIVKDTIVCFYKLKIRALEIGVRLNEKYKNINEIVRSMPDVIATFAENQADLEIARQEFDKFLLTGELPDK